MIGLPLWDTVSMNFDTINMLNSIRKIVILHPYLPVMPPPLGGGGTLGISWWGCAAGTLVPLTFTRASAAEFCYPILE